ncbi:pitrilysin family protein [Telmatospirillum sp. J64-1]|uniref:M16 family metallopeptidase n=1 Tax=Telmatospirillum sp. J64-1 TaxID=2502183 RepID=UPI00115D236E|nr:pitrilysin family protein [Telmatospirillum sp. J64-1]
MLKKAFFALVLLLLPVLPAQAAVQVERVTSPGGIEAWLVRDHTNPIIAVEFAFRGGAALDPEEKAGLANMVSGLLDEGAGDMDSLAFQRRLEDLAVRLGFSAGQDNFTGRLQTLTENRDAAFEMLRMALTAPRFDAEPVERIRNQILAGLRRELQDPNTVAFREWYRVVFPGHPYGRPVRGSPETVQAITADDLRQFVSRQFGRDNLVIGVVGDITPEDLGPLLDATFGDLPAEVRPALAPEVEPQLSGEVTVIQRNIPQSVAVFGEEGIDRQDPDFYTAYLLNYVMGGGSFSSRLMEEVRAKRGLAYSVYTYLQSMDRAAIMGGAVATANPRLAESIDLIRQEWQRMAEQGVSEEELENAKTYIKGSFPLQLDSTGSIASMLVSMQIDDLGIDYLEKRNEYFDAVTLDDMRRVAQRLYQPERLTVVVVGDPEGLSAAAQ